MAPKTVRRLDPGSQSIHLHPPKTKVEPHRKYTGGIRRGECHIPCTVACDLRSSFRKECGTAVSAVIGCVATIFSSSISPYDEDPVLFTRSDARIVKHIHGDRYALWCGLRNV